MNKTLATLQVLTGSPVIGSLSLRKPCWGIPRAWSCSSRMWSHFQQLWELAGVISTSQIMKQDLEKWSGSPKMAQPVSELRLGATLMCRHGAGLPAALPKITGSYFILFFLSHFVHMLSNWRAGWKRTDVQPIPFSTTESTSLNYVMVSWLKDSCFGGLVVCFPYLSGMLWPTRQNAYLAALGLWKNVFCGAEASFPGSLCDTYEFKAPKAGKQPESVCARGEAVRAGHTSVTP